MSTPSQIFDNELQALKGIYPGNDWTVQSVFPLHDDVTASDVKAGMAVYMDPTDKKWKLGIGPVSSATVRHMVHLLFHNGTDYCVAGDDGNDVNFDGGPMGIAVSNAGEVSVTSGSYDTAVYAPGELLTAGSDGKIEKWTAGNGTVIGTVSTGTEAHEQNSSIDRLSFYTLFVPTWA